MPGRAWRYRRGSFRRRIAELRELMHRIDVKKRMEWIKRIRNAVSRHAKEMRDRVKGFAVEFRIRNVNIDSAHKIEREVRRIAWTTELATILHMGIISYLIMHRTCRTSKVSYVNLKYALQYDVNRIKSIYLAVQNILLRKFRKLAVSTHILHPDAPSDIKQALAFLTALLIKYAYRFFTTVMKIAERIRDWNARIKVEFRSGYFVEMRAYAWAFAGWIAERIRAIALGFRELALRRLVRHCSAYASIEGIKYTGWVSGWKIWKKRWRICSRYCNNYIHWQKDVCYQICEDLMHSIEPDRLEFALNYLPSYVQKYMNRLIR